MTPCELCLDTCVLNQRTTFLSSSSQASNLLNFVAMEPHCLQHTVPSSLDICSTQRSPVHLVGMQGISNRDTHLYRLHNNSSVRLTKITMRLAASKLVSDVSAPVYTNGVWPLLRIVSVAQKIKPLTMPNPSISPWTARTDGFGWWDSRLAAQHEPRDLTRPSSGLKELTQTMMKQLVLAFCRQSHQSQPRCAVVFMFWIN